MRQFLALCLCLLGLSAHAGIEFVAGSFDSSAGGAGSTETPGEPAGCAQDDLVLALYSVDKTDGAVGHPSDFTELDDFTITAFGAPTRHVWLGWKIRGATAGETYEWTYSGTAGISAASVLCFTDVNATQLDVSYVRANHYTIAENTPNLAGAAITTTTNNAMVVIAGFYNTIISGNAGPSAGYTQLYDQLTGTLESRRHYWQGKIVATAGTEETPGVFTHDDTNNTTDPALFTLAIRPASSAPIFTGPTLAGATNGYTVSGTLTGSGVLTAYAVAVPPVQAAPTCAQIKAGNNASGTAAALANSKVWTTAVSDTVALTQAGSLPRHDVHVCGSDGTTDTAVTSTNNANRNADTNQTIVVLTTPSATGFLTAPTETGNTTAGSDIITELTDTSDFVRNQEVTVSAGFASPSATYIIKNISPTTIQLDTAATSTQTGVTVTAVWPIDPAVVAGDMLEADTITSDSKTVTHGTDGDFIIAAAGAALQDIDYCLEDVSATSGEFTEPSWSVDCDVKIYVNNVGPVCDSEDDIYLFNLDEAITSINLDALCSDTQSLTYAIRAHDSAAVPAGMAISSAGVWSGTPNVANTSGAAIKLLARDPGNLVNIMEFTSYVVGTVSMPVLDTGDRDNAFSVMQTTRPWNVNEQFVAVNKSCGTEALDQVLSQSPAATTAIGAQEEVSITVSNARPPCRRRL